MLIYTNKAIKPAKKDHPKEPQTETSTFNNSSTEGPETEQTSASAGDGRESRSPEPRG